MNTEISVPFGKDSIRCVETTEGEYVALKPICETLGLDWSNQLKRLKGRENIYSMAIFAIESGRGDRETTCIPRSRLALWLALINPNSVAEHLRPVLELYQNKCADVLDAHFRGQTRAVKAEYDRLCWHALAANPTWAKIHALYQARVDRTMVHAHIKKGFDATLALIEEMERCGVIGQYGWGDDSSEPTAAVFTNRTVRRAYLNGYVSPSGETKAPMFRGKTGFEPVLDGDCDANGGGQNHGSSSAAPPYCPRKGH